MEKDLLSLENETETNYRRTKMQKEIVLQSLKENGCRITKQRKIVSVIVEPCEKECK